MKNRGMGRDPLKGHQRRPRHAKQIGIPGTPLDESEVGSRSRPRGLTVEL